MAKTEIAGKIIFLNGASSSGKSTIAAAMQKELELPFWHYSIDHLFAAKVLPDLTRFSWAELRPKFFDGFHRSISELARAGNHLIVEHIVEEADWQARLDRLFDGLDVFYIGVHCPLEELERRELARGDRRIGDARRDFETIHQYCRYDFEVNSTEPLDQTAKSVIQAWQSRNQ